MNVETDGSSVLQTELGCRAVLFSVFLTLPGISYTSRPPATRSGPRCFWESFPRVRIQPRAGLRAQLTSHGPPRGAGARGGRAGEKWAWAGVIHGLGSFGARRGCQVTLPGPPLSG